jgi:hypothetical protein
VQHPHEEDGGRQCSLAEDEQHTRGASGGTRKWDSPTVLRLRSLTLDWREERSDSVQPKGESRAAALTKWSFLPGLRKTARFVELSAGMNKSLPGRDLAAACAELLQRAQLVRVSSRVAGRAQAEFGDGARPRARGWPARWSGDVVSTIDLHGGEKDEQRRVVSSGHR